MNVLVLSKEVLKIGRDYLDKLALPEQCHVEALSNIALAEVGVEPTPQAL